MMPEQLTAVWVEEVDHRAGESIAVARGYADDDGRPVTFAGDHRSMFAIAEALEEEHEPVLAYVSDWQLL